MLKFKLFYCITKLSNFNKYIGEIAFSELTNIKPNFG